MSETEKFVPQEARSSSTEEQPEKSEKSKELKSAVRGEAKASGTPRHREDAEGNLITPEKTERYHHPESTKEFEPGYGPNPSWSRAPADTTDVASSDVADDMAASAESLESAQEAEAQKELEAQKEADIAEGMAAVQAAREKEQREWEEEQTKLHQQNEAQRQFQETLRSSQKSEALAPEEIVAGTERSGELTDRGIAAMRGEATPPSNDIPPPDLPPGSSPGGPPETGETLKGAPIPPELRDEIRRIQSLPADQRPDAVAELHQQRNLLGNTPKEIEQLRELSSGVLPDGRGVFFVDEKGNKMVIPYEDEI